MLSRESIEPFTALCQSSPIRTFARSHLEALDKLAELEATLDRADVHTAGMLERLEAMEKENAALKAQLADVERKAVERERKAWDEAIEWAQDCERQYVAERWSPCYPAKERDRRYPLPPKEEGR